jgi:hypothetical protein
MADILSPRFASPLATREFRLRRLVVQIPRAIAVLIALLFSSVLANAGRASMPFYSLPVEAQASIPAELARSVPGICWVKLAKLTASDGLNSYQPGMGWAVSVSGNTVAVGASGAQIGQIVGAGALYVFVKPRTGWKNMRQIAKLTASDGTYTAGLGGSVTIVGNTIVAGAPAATVGGNAPQGRGLRLCEADRQLGGHDRDWRAKSFGRSRPRPLR